MAAERKQNDSMPAFLLILALRLPHSGRTRARFLGRVCSSMTTKRKTQSQSFHGHLGLSLKEPRLYHFQLYLVSASSESCCLQKKQEISACDVVYPKVLLISLSTLKYEVTRIDWGSFFQVSLPTAPSKLCLICLFSQKFPRRTSCNAQLLPSHQNFYL